MSSHCPARVALLAVAGLACTASAQSLTLEFRADRTQAAVGEVVHWEVIATRTGYTDPTSYFLGFYGPYPQYGRFIASRTEAGVIREFEGFASLKVDATSPEFDGASIINLYYYQTAFLSSVDKANPIRIAWFDVEIADATTPLWYDGHGIATVMPDHGLFTIPHEYHRPPNPDQPDFYGVIRTFAVLTDIVNNPGCGPADLAAPFGVHDAADIARFVELFLDRAPIIDFAEPLGVYDLADIVAFVNRFIEGCP